MSRFHVLLTLSLCGAVGAGCSSAIVKVNEVAMRRSLSTEKDRQLAQETLVRLPEGALDYKIGAGDVLEIGVFQWELSEETKTLDVRVSQEGIISLPLIGDLNVAGKAVQQVRVTIEQALRAGDLIKNPRVSVVLKEFRSNRVAVVGAVKDPGVYTLRENVTRLLDVLSLAGGLMETAGRQLYIVRTRAGAGKQVISIDLYDLMTGGDLALDVVLSDGDVVNVPVAERFFVYGYVQKPGAYDLKQDVTVLQAIAMAGGLQQPTASPSACTLRRGAQKFPVDLVTIADGKEPDIQLEGNDIIEVRQTFLRKVALTLWETVTRVINVGYVLNP